MQNLDQTRIFYKVGQTWMTRKKVTRITRPGCNAGAHLVSLSTTLACVCVCPS